MIKKTILSFLTASVFCTASYANEVNIYSERKEALIKPLLDTFSSKTGIKVNLVTGKGDALLTRLKSEGRRSKADILITSDAGRLARAKAYKVIQPLPKNVNTHAVPKQYIDTDNQWLGLTIRARAIVYSPQTVNASELSTYEDLAAPKWKGKICVRSSNNIYNQSLVASMLAHHGTEQTQAWLNGFVANFARKPQGGDRDQIKAVAAGLCDIALVNSYYFGAMLNSDENTKATAEKVRIFWPNQNDRGTHVNVSGIALTKSAKNVDNATKLINFLLNQQSQDWYAGVNNEYPVLDGVEISETLKSWGDFKADSINVGILGENNKRAVMAMDKAGWK